MTFEPMPMNTTEVFYNDNRLDGIAAGSKRWTRKEIPPYSKEDDGLWLRDFIFYANPENKELHKLDIKKLSRPYRQREGWIECFEQRNSYFFVTVPFLHCFSDQHILDSSGFLMKAASRAIWGDDAFEDNCYLRGYGVAEPHIYSLEARGYLHMHFVLDGFEHEVSKFTCDRMANVLNEEADRVRAGRKVRRKGEEIPRGHIMIAPNAIDVRQVTYKRGAAIYLTKCMSTRQWANGDNIFFIDKKGLADVVLPGYRSPLEF